MAPRHRWSLSARRLALAAGQTLLAATLAAACGMAGHGQAGLASPGAGSHQTGSNESRLPLIRSVPTRHEVCGLAVSGDGRTLAAATVGPPGWGDITLYSTVTWRPLKKVRCPDLMKSLALSHDGRLVACGDWDGRVTVWSTRTGAVLWRLARHSPPLAGVHTVLFDPTGRELISGGEDDSVICWELATGRRKWTRQLKGHLRWLAMAPDGRVLAASIDKQGVALFARAGTGDLRRLGTEGVVTHVAFVRAGRALMVVALGPADSVWDEHTLQRITLLPGHERAARAAVASLGGTVVATSDDVAGVTIRSAVDWHIIAKWRSSDGYAPELCLAPDGSWLAANSLTKMFTIWRLPVVAPTPRQ